MTRVLTSKRLAPLLVFVCLLGARPAFPQFAQTEVDLATDNQDFTVFGSTPADQVGSAGAIGDVNGDGIGDLIIGARGGQGPGDARGTTTGEVYIRFGTKMYGRTQDLFVTPPNVVIYGVGAQDQFGRSLAVADVNNDGKKDIIIGAPLADGPADGRGGCGEVYILYGRSVWPA